LAVVEYPIEHLPVLQGKRSSHYEYEMTTASPQMDQDDQSLLEMTTNSPQMDQDDQSLFEMTTNSPQMDQDHQCTSLFVSYARMNPYAVCASPPIAQKCGATASRISEPFVEGASPTNDDGIVLNDYKALQDFLTESNEAKNFALVRFGDGWDFAVRASNHMWDSIARGIQWQHLSVSTPRVNTHDCPSCNVSSTIPELKLYQVDSKRQTISSIESPALDLGEYYGRDQFDAYDTDKRVFRYLRDVTNQAVDCAMLESLGLPAYTPCSTKDADKVSPPKVNGVFQIQQRAHFEFLMENFENVFLNLYDPDDGFEFFSLEDGIYQSYSDQFNDLDEFVEAAVNQTAVGIQIAQSVFEQLAMEHQTAISDGVVALAMSPRTPTSVKVAAHELYSKFDGGNFPWFAIDKCGIDFGMMADSPCMVGTFGQQKASPLDSVEPECYGTHGYIGSEQGCETWNPSKLDETMDEFRRKIARIKSSVLPKSDSLVSPDELSAVLKLGQENAFVWYDMHEKRDMRNEAWEMLVQLVRNNTLVDIGLPPVKLMRIECYNKEGEKEDVCGNMNSYPQFLLHMVGDEMPTPFRFMDNTNDAITFSQRLSDAMLAFLQKNLRGKNKNGA
ncbi:MAG: hypothetical protein SGARI_000679, partial [Bacillariaceae sp.]